MDDDDDDPNPSETPNTASETPNTGSINSVIENAKSLYNNLTNLVNQNQPNKENPDSTSNPITIQLNQQKSLPPKQNYSFVKTNERREIERIAREIAQYAQQSAVNNNSQPLQTQHTNRTTTQTTTQSPRQTTQQTAQQRTQQTPAGQQHNQQIPSNITTNNNLNQNSYTQSSQSYKSSAPVVSTHAPTQQSHKTNNSSSSSTTSNSSDHIKFDFDSGGNICSIRCQICDENIPVGAGNKNISSHVTGEKHMRLKLTYNRNTVNTIANTSHSRPSAAHQANTQYSTTYPQRKYDFNHYNQHSTNNAFQAQYPMQSNYMTAHTPPPQQYHSQMNYYAPQVPQYYPPTPQYQSVPPQAHQTPGLPPPNTSQYNPIPNNYMNYSHHNQSQYTYPY